MQNMKGSCEGGGATTVGGEAGLLLLLLLLLWQCDSHRRQEPFLVTCKTYTKPSTFVKYVIKFVSGTNPIANSKFAEQYVKNNKASQIF
jgi:hypothetical protein